MSFLAATGDFVQATVTFDDTAVAGQVRVTIAIAPGSTAGDINGFFVDVGDPALLAGLTVTGSDVNWVTKGLDSVTSAGPGNTVNGGGLGIFDLGLRIGSPGIGGDDIQSTTFVFAHSTAALTNDLFTDTGDDVLFAVRVTSVGPADGDRSGSSKLRDAGEVPGPEIPPTGSTVPEPSTLAGLAVLGGLGLACRRLRRR
jgi:hypothetical protein